MTWGWRIFRIVAAVVASSMAGCAILNAAAQQLGVQAAAEPNFARDMWEFAKGAGPFGTVLMWYVWQRADNERRKLQGERDALLERVLTALNTAATGLTQQSSLLQSVLGRKT